jgi:glycosyltransferase involved in cell wall biosynthesis
VTGIDNADAMTVTRIGITVSVFTPLSSAGNPYIGEAYDSLVAQTFQAWEWVILPNHGGEVPERVTKDPRVRIINADGLPPSVGALKRAAALACKGDWLVELDHDDVLDPHALSSVRSADYSADFLYSDFAEFHHEGTRPNPYDATYGWESKAVQFRGKWLLAMTAPSDPISWRRVLWAPNHLRAWRRERYVALGGHDPELVFGDDLDLVLRTYISGARCVRLPHCLYFYRVHAEQNVKLNSPRIQEICGHIYDRHIYALAESCAEYRGLDLVDLCGAHGCPGKYTPLDIALGHDLNGTWPLVDDSVGVIRAFDAIEHLRDPVHTMNEAWRVLAPGGVMLINVPSTEGPGAWCDPTHVSFWNELSFRYYCDNAFRKYVPGVRARFQLSGVSRQTVHVESPASGTVGIPYIKAELIALKDGYRPMGEVRC